ncbi:MAG TPA: hypothetical protein GXZ74_09250 [Tissierellia bacterium]|nr:hypothetical protein [Tissierellia bacterium]
MKKILLIALTMTLLISNTLAAFAYSEPNDIEPLNTRYRRVIEKGIEVEQGRRTVTSADLASSERIKNIVAASFGYVAPPYGLTLTMIILVGDHIYQNDLTGTFISYRQVETWYQEHRLTGARHHEATYYNYRTVLPDGSQITNRVRLR